MLPDVIPADPIDIRTSRKGGRRKLEFTAKVGNIGQGPLIFEGKTISIDDKLYTHAWQIIKMRDGGECARSAGQFVYHPQHTHYHVNRWVEYTLRNGSPESTDIAANGYKASFCLLDTENIRGYSPDIYPQTRGLSCGTSEGRQGISVGWRDVYERHLPDQNIDLDGPDPVDAGGYFLVIRVDPEEMIWELDKSNNMVFAVVGVSLAPPSREDPARQPPILPDNAVPVKPGRLPTPGPTSNVPTPVVTPGPEGRPTKVAKPTKPPKPPKPTRGDGGRPERPPKPTRPSRGGENTVPTPRPNQQTPTATRPGASTPTPTLPRSGNPPPITGCNATCPFNLKQMRMTWLEATGLSLSGTIDMRGCPTIPLSGTQNGFLNTYNWMTEDFASDTGIQHNLTFTLQDGAGTTSTGGQFTATQSNSTALFSYALSAPPPANAEDGQNFPVVFDLCMGIGDQVIQGRLVCQPKATGMLCHE